MVDAVQEGFVFFSYVRLFWIMPVQEHKASTQDKPYDQARNDDPCQKKFDIIFHADDPGIS